MVFLLVGGANDVINSFNREASSCGIADGAEVEALLDEFIGEGVRVAWEHNVGSLGELLQNFFHVWVDGSQSPWQVNKGSET